MILKLSIINLFLSVLSFGALAETRIYLHEITSNQPLGDVLTYATTSVLDRRQYERFFGGRSQLIKVKSVKSWTCPDHTGFHKDTCPDETGRVYPRGDFPVDLIQSK